MEEARLCSIHGQNPSQPRTLPPPGGGVAGQCPLGLQPETQKSCRLCGCDQALACLPCVPCSPLHAAPGGLGWWTSVWQSSSRQASGAKCGHSDGSPSQEGTGPAASPPPLPPFMVTAQRPRQSPCRVQSPLPTPPLCLSPPSLPPSRTHWKARLCVELGPPLLAPVRNDHRREWPPWGHHTLHHRTQRADPSR